MLRTVSLVLLLALLAVGAPGALAAQAGDPGVDKGGSIDPDGITAPATWSPPEATATNCVLESCTDRGGVIDPNGTTAPPQDQGFLGLWLTWLRGLFSL